MLGKVEQWVLEQIETRSIVALVALMICVLYLELANLVALVWPPAALGMKWDATHPVLRLLVTLLATISIIRLITPFWDRSIFSNLVASLTTSLFVLGLCVRLFDPGEMQLGDYVVPEWVLICYFPATAFIFTTALIEKIAEPPAQPDNRGATFAWLFLGPSGLILTFQGSFGVPADQPLSQMTGFTLLAASLLLSPKDADLREALPSPEQTKEPGGGSLDSLGLRNQSRFTGDNSQMVQAVVAAPEGLIVGTEMLSIGQGVLEAGGKAEYPTDGGAGRVRI